MKVYVSELPPNCAYCSFWVDGRCIVDDGSAFCPLEVNKIKTQSLSDYTKQVRKEVCDEIRKEIKKLINKDFKLCNHEYANGYCYGLQYDLAKILDQIEKGETNGFK